MLKDISRNNIGILLASHDLDMVERYADQVLLIKNNTLQRLTKPFSNLSEYIF